MRRLWSHPLFHLPAVVAGCIFLTVVYSCADKGAEERSAAMAARMDSLNSVITGQDSVLARLGGYFAEIAECVDSLSEQEGMLYETRDPETGKKLSQRDMTARVDMFRTLLDRQRNRIDSLTRLLASRSDTTQIAALKSVIDYLNRQLALKDEQLERLKDELSASRNENMSLSRETKSLRKNVDRLEVENSVKAQVLEKQSEMINEGFVKIADKKTLQRDGILTSGFLKKTKLNTGNLDRTMMTAVDIRNFREITLNSKKPKILTPVPTGCYELIDDGSGRTKLRITDVSKFWSLSNMLVIQL